MSELERWLTPEGRAKIDRLFAEEDMDEPVEDVLAAFERGVKGVTAEPDDGITCDCCKKKSTRGWKGKVPVALDGTTWPIGFAARMLGCNEKDLRDLIRIVGLEPAGTLKMTAYRRSGRHPRGYDASKLVALWDGVQELIRHLDSLYCPPGTNRA